MSDLIRDAPLGQLIRFVTRNRVLKYPEERDDWECPVHQYGGGQVEDNKSVSDDTTPVASPATEAEKELELAAAASDDNLRKLPTQPDTERVATRTSTNARATQTLSRVMSSAQMSRVGTQADLTDAYNDAVRQETVKTEKSRPLTPERTADNRILVTWYTTDDPENPQNWSQKKKGFVIALIYLYTTAVYIAGAIYTPSAPYIAKQFGLNQQSVSTGLSMYVVGYGVGALFFSPMSEIPLVGRNPPYIITFFLFLMVTIPLSLMNNFPGFVVLRLFQGIFGSPALATGGATITDIYNLLQMPYLLTGWAGAATAGPSLGPMISGFSVPAEDWHWSMWEVLWLAGPVFIALFIGLPETSSSNILLRRAKRLRERARRAGNPEQANMLVAQSEIDQASMTVGKIVEENLLRPFQINLLDPSVAFTSLYIGLIYGVYYSFFECFPLVYGTGLPAPSPTRGYGMNLGQQGLIFLSIAVGVVISIVIYIIYLHWWANPALRAQLAQGQLAAPEGRLAIGLFASFIPPASMFMFAWTAFNSPDIPWIVPTIAIALFTVAVFLMFQVIFIYLALSYPQYSASLFAMNDAVRSCIAGGAIHFATPLFHNLGIGRGNSLLAGLMVMGVIGIFVLYFKGAYLRSRSKFAAK